MLRDAYTTRGVPRSCAFYRIISRRRRTRRADIRSRIPDNLNVKRSRASPAQINITRFDRFVSCSPTGQRNRYAAFTTILFNGLPEPGREQHRRRRFARLLCRFSSPPDLSNGTDGTDAYKPHNVHTASARNTDCCLCAFGVRSCNATRWDCNNVRAQPYRFTAATVYRGYHHRGNGRRRATRTALEEGPPNQ